jgi:hypothetical protein
MCIDMMFEVYGHHNTSLIAMTIINMCLKDAIVHYTDKVMADFGSSFELVSM